MEVAGEVLQSGSSQEFHVLAVDDSYVDRKVIEKLLKISSCKVTAVESGARALQFLGLDGGKGSLGFNGLKVNLIITDYSMPGMTGYELLKKIKRSSAFSEIPVVIMSSENILTRIDSCLEEGAEEFLVKPVKLSDVKRLTKDCLTRGETEGKDGRRVDQRKLTKDCIMRCETEGKDGKRVDKRKLQDDNHTSSLSTPSSPSNTTPFGCDLATSELLSSAPHSSKRPKRHARD